ncbi:Cyanophycinase [compost metagenome]
MKKLVLFGVLLSLLSTHLIAQQVQSKVKFPKGKLFIIGGGDRPDALVKRMITEASLGANDYVVILPMASEEPDSAYFYAKKQFVNAGLRTVNCTISTKQSLSSSALDSLANAKLIYISGGDQTRFMNSINGSAVRAVIEKAYLNGAMIAGTSAGAAVMSKEMITGNELLHKEYRATPQVIEDGNIEIKEGLGLLTSAVIDQHFLIRSRHNRLLSMVIEYPSKKAIGIDESTAILIKNGWAEVVGISQVIVYQNPTKSKSVGNNKLGAKGLKVDIYLPGEKFAL